MRTADRPVVKLTLIAASVLLCVLGAELASRAFWRFEYSVPARHPDRILYAFFPELRTVDAARPSHDDGFYDVLLLGASVLNPEWAPIEQDLSEQLALRGQRNVRIFNLAFPSQTTRDSRLKYEALGDARFELVVVYHGINETRANNVPPDLYKDDYGHYAWYDTVNALASYHGVATFALPYTLRYLTLEITHKARRDDYLSVDEPRPDWIQSGGDIRSTASFEHNLTAILELSRARNDRVLLMTFATHVPDNYTRDAFMAHQLDYAEYSMPIEVWGQKDNVVRAVAAHNTVIRKLVAERKDVLFVDQATLMTQTPGGEVLYNDPCHFTVSGAHKFVTNLLTAWPLR